MGEVRRQEFDYEDGDLAYVALLVYSEIFYLWGLRGLANPRE